MAKLLLILALAVAHASADCWWTGCQPNDWGTVGCAQYGRVEAGREGCVDERGVAGYLYNCCTDDGGGNPTPPPGEGFVTFSQFSNGVTSNGYPAPSQEQYNNFNNFAASSGRISSVQEAAMCLAQLLHESDGLRAKREYACEHTNCPESYRTPGCDAAGQYYYGRGYIQLTWCDNYKSASSALFGDQRLVNDADSVARDDSLAWRTAFWYWAAVVHDYPGVQQGQFGATTKAINGALECSAPGHPTPPKRFQLYGNVRSAFGLSGAGDPAGCA